MKTRVQEEAEGRGLRKQGPVHAAQTHNVPDALLLLRHTRGHLGERVERVVVRGVAVGRVLDHAVQHLDHLPAVHRRELVTVAVASSHGPAGHEVACKLADAPRSALQQRLCARALQSGQRGGWWGEGKRREEEIR